MVDKYYRLLLEINTNGKFIFLIIIVFNMSAPLNVDYVNNLVCFLWFWRQILIPNTKVILV